MSALSRTAWVAMGCLLVSSKSARAGANPPEEDYCAVIKAVVALPQTARIMVISKLRPVPVTLALSTAPHGASSFATESVVDCRASNFVAVDASGAAQEPDGFGMSIYLRPTGPHTYWFFAQAITVGSDFNKGNVSGPDPVRGTVELTAGKWTAVFTPAGLSSSQGGMGRTIGRTAKPDAGGPK